MAQPSEVLTLEPEATSSAVGNFPSAVGDDSSDIGEEEKKEALDQD